MKERGNGDEKERESKGAILRESCRESGRDKGKGSERNLLRKNERVTMKQKIRKIERRS